MQDLSNFTMPLLVAEAKKYDIARRTRMKRGELISRLIAMYPLRYTSSVAYAEYVVPPSKAKTTESRPLRRSTNDLYVRPDASTGFPNPFTPEYEAGYQAGRASAARTNITSLNYNTGYDDGVSDELASFLNSRSIL